MGISIMGLRNKNIQKSGRTNHGRLIRMRLPWLASCR